MRTTVIILSFFCVLVASRRTYKAAVVNYVPHHKYVNNDSEIIKENTSKFSYYIEECIKCDIVIFPEYSLFSKDFNRAFVRELAIKVPTPPAVGICSQGSNNFITRMSCISKQFEKYVVVNILEIDDGNLYNTNIVFDREGTLISKYRKRHLSVGEQQFLTPGQDSVIFYTDFEGAFSLLIGEDVLYAGSDGLAPNVILTTSLKSKLPFFGALSIYDGFSKHYGVNLLVADYNAQPEQNGASGFYLASNSTKSEITTSQETSKPIESIIETHPKFLDICHREEQSPKGIFAYKPNTIEKDSSVKEDFKNYRFQPLKNGANELKLVSSDGKLLCEFKVNIILVPDMIYVAAVYSDKESQGYGCAVLVCEGSDLNTCGGRHLQSKSVQITSIEIKADNKNVDFKNPNIPITLTYDLKPIGMYTYCADDDGITMKSSQHLSDIITFGFFGRNPIGFNDPSKPNSAHLNGVSLALSLLAATLYLLH
ncbi:PREDICTED: pantetheinase-like isoform X2 [Nicrophorus vespilloides]|nr:PREDICTED: pantetheinase-like isoform X2 [Nicrophorus vespilloides]XP_017771970.1 PREDICTED: pantetheinase-like isoform X2 [Nicrophorus vespilloides]XP_017771971.1 PREDICTED: pantetheinase-like isoform X2 [Nicrophorus vespilloides]XP_017771972.1 PREDICTED: pantetheinase-like isoform X2 [Nicrophorus vespilloides]